MNFFKKDLRKNKKGFRSFNKRGGDVITPKIIALIVLTACFFVLLFWILSVDFPGDTKKEICHNSVVLRGNNPVSADTTPLKCRTEYICSSEDKSCERMVNPETQEVETKEQVYKFLADKMVDCWWMFGEGNIDYIGKKTTKANYCSICYQVAFDDSVKKIFPTGKISKDDFYEYLSDTKVSGKDITYAEYFFGTKNINALKTLASRQYNIKGTFGSIDLNKQYYIMMGITSEVSMAKWASIGALQGGAVAIGTFVLGFLGVTTPIGWVVGAAIIGGGAIIGAGESHLYDSIDPEISSILVQGKNVDNNFMAPTIIEADADKYKALNCADVATLE